MSYTIERSGFTLVPELIRSVIVDLSANGFTLKFPTTPIVSPAPTSFTATLEASATVDPLATTQPWRIHFSVIDAFQAKAYVASPTQLPDDGSVSKLEIGFSTTQDSAGVLGTDLIYPYKLDSSTLIIPQPEPQTGTTYTAASVARVKRINNADSQFIDRTVRIPDVATAASYPMSYRLAITPRGVMLVVWEEGQDATGNRFSWFCVQRPVDRNTGVVLADDVNTKCPVFCVYGLPDMYIPAALRVDSSGGSSSSQPQVLIPERWESGVKKFVVRERDVLKPTPSVPASYDTADSNAIINAQQQVAITEDNKYVVIFPNRLNTPRYAYTHELDMLAFTSSDVISQWSDVPVTVYGEAQARTYKAMLANGANNTNMRILVLSAGGGIS